MKIFFKFPELLLVIALLLCPLFVANFAIDIHMSDTYYVFGSSKPGWNTTLVSVSYFLIPTWIAHILSRKFNLFPLSIRWAQIVLTIICLAALAWYFRPAYTRASLPNPEISHRFLERAHALMNIEATFVLLQFIAWIAVLVAVIRLFIIRALR